MQTNRVFCPLVSIVIPVYNGANFMREAIDSALTQTYKNIEVIVINDGSTDGGQTEAIAKSYGSKIRYLHKGNDGVASALNLGIQHMQGEFFSWLSHDDVYCPEKIEFQARFWPEGKEPVILFSDYELIDEHSVFIRDIRYRPERNKALIYSLLVGSHINGCTLLIPKTFFSKTGRFDEKLKTTQDNDLLFRFLKKYKFVHVPQILVKSRQHQSRGSVTMQTVYMREKNDLFLQVLKNFSLNEIYNAKNKHDSAAGYIKIALRLKDRALQIAASDSLERARAILQKKMPRFAIPLCLFIQARYWNGRFFWKRYVVNLLKFLHLK
jgi:glycosyltransferase involved in cell wall biosynthesis